MSFSQNYIDRIYAWVHYLYFSGTSLRIFFSCLLNNLMKFIKILEVPLMYQHIIVHYSLTYYGVTHIIFPPVNNVVILNLFGLILPLVLEMVCYMHSFIFNISKECLGSVLFRTVIDILQ